MTRRAPKPAAPKRGASAGAERRFLVAVDVALVAVRQDGLSTLTVMRTEHPFRGRHALPGGFVRMDESLDRAAARVLEEKAALREVYLEQLYTFGDPKRDPRTRVISVAYFALVDPARFDACARVSPGVSVCRISIPWAGEAGGPVELSHSRGEPVRLAFDHAEILGLAVKRLRGKLAYTPIGFQLLPVRFTLLDLQRVHETILGRPLEKNSFRRRMIASGELEATGEIERDVGHRPAALYRFSRRSAI